MGGWAELTCPGPRCDLGQDNDILNPKRGFMAADRGHCSGTPTWGVSAALRRGEDVDGPRGHGLLTKGVVHKSHVCVAAP